MDTLDVFSFPTPDAAIPVEPFSRDPLALVDPKDIAGLNEPLPETEFSSKEDPASIETEFLLNPSPLPTRSATPQPSSVDPLTRQTLLPTGVFEVGASEDNWLFSAWKAWRIFFREPPSLTGWPPFAL